MAKVRSFDHAVRLLAAEKLAGSKPDDIVRQLGKHGIGSLEDLAAKVIENASHALRGGASASFDDDIPMICYKFTSFRPVVGLGEIEQQVADLNTLVRGNA